MFEAGPCEYLFPACLQKSNGLHMLRPAMEGISSEIAQGIFKASHFARRKASIVGKPLSPFVEIKRHAGRHDAELHLVMERGLLPERAQIPGDKSRCQRIIYCRRHEGSKARAHIHIRPSREGNQKAVRSHIAIAILGALGGPDLVRDKEAVEAEGKGTRRGSYDLCRVPVRHHTEYGVAAGQERRCFCGGAPRLHRLIESLIALFIIDTGSGPLDSDGADLKDMNAPRFVDGKFDIKRIVLKKRFQFRDRTQNIAQRSGKKTRK